MDETCKHGALVCEACAREDERRRCAAAICGYCYGPESETRRKMAVEFQPELGEYWHQWGDDYPIGRSRCHASAIHALASTGEK